MRCRLVITIATSNSNDAENILALQKLAYESEARLYNDWSIPPLTQSLTSLLKEFEDHVILKAMDNECIIGSVRARVNKGSCAIGRLIVHPGYQGRGIGSMLLEEIEKSTSASASRYELFTGSKSEANIRLYLRHGYTITHTKSLSPNVALTFLQKSTNATCLQIT